MRLSPLRTCCPDEVHVLRGMLNYGEELAYWYLRLNGCFPITDFVLHKGKQIEHSSDSDVLAIRPPFSCEELLKWPGDYHQFICQHAQQPGYLGIICQVKTGKDVQPDELFPEQDVVYSLDKLGLCVQRTKAIVALRNNRYADPQTGVRILKLLIAHDQFDHPNFESLTLKDIRGFIRLRFETHKARKYGDRLFFPSALIQNMADEIFHG
jgi:hypothetical protein